MTAAELRKKFLDFFSAKGHKIIPSASLVPDETDPTVLFTTAGMHPFKQYYLEPNETELSRAATIQKCARTVDIEEVGDKTHLTFFEMLGNFSFGYPAKENSYFKEDALQYAWDFLTKEIGIDKSKIHATYFQGDKELLEDKESLEILKKLDGLKEIKPQGAEDNFWSLGTEGSPGGPTVEFYVDGIEIWNCVFNEYVFKSGKYETLESKGVDTGMGLERILAVLNGLDNVYETELFKPIIEKIEEVSGKKYGEHKKEFRIIADHIKASVFLLSDGVEPSNKDRGYILRRLIRRAVALVNIDNINFDSKKFKLVAQVVLDIYKDTYQEFKREDECIDILGKLSMEIRKFRATIEKGLREFNKGVDPFILFTTYGFPIELTKELAKKKGTKVDESDFNKKLKKHQELSRTASAGKFKGGLADAGERTKKLHTATHLLLAALRKVLGDHIFQKGSNITTERLRFDFSHPEKLTDEQKKKVEDLVNEIIEKDLPVTFEEVSLDEAKKVGAIGVFEAKYGDKVKVYTIGPSAGSGQALSAGSGIPPFSREICGGPHIKKTGELGHFKIKKEQSSGAGVRRIKAILE